MRWSMRKWILVSRLCSEYDAGQRGKNAYVNTSKFCNHHLQNICMATVSVFIAVVLIAVYSYNSYYYMPTSELIKDLLNIIIFWHAFHIFKLENQADGLFHFYQLFADSQFWEYCIIRDFPSFNGPHRLQNLWITTRGTLSVSMWQPNYLQTHREQMFCVNRPPPQTDTTAHA